LAASAHRPWRESPPPLEGPVDIDSLYRVYAAQVGRWAARLGGPSVEVEDVVQEVFLVAKRRLRTFDAGGGKITTWLFRTTERIVKSARRKQRLRRLWGHSPEEILTVPDTSRALPGSALERQQEIVHVYRVLDQLPERQRKVLILFELEGLPTAEIAALTGARVGTVRVWLYRARAAFLERWERMFSSDGHDFKRSEST